MSLILSVCVLIQLTTFKNATDLNAANDTDTVNN